MQRWNGWGDENVSAELPKPACDLLHKLIGKGNPRADYPLEKTIASIPQTRLPEHPLVSTDPHERLHHSHGQSLPDWIDLRWGTLATFPDGAALPKTCEDVAELLAFAQKHNAVVIPFGGGTSVVGHLQAPSDKGPVLSLSLRRLQRLLELQPSNMLATFEAGIRGLELEAQLRKQRFTLGHYPQSFEFSTLGGWVATRSSGQQSSHYGSIEQLFAGGELVTPRGSLNLPPFPASAAGPDLRHLVLGSEGRLGVLTKVTVRISPLPQKDGVYGLFFPNWNCARDAIRALAVAGLPYSMIRLSNPLETMTNLALTGDERRVALLKQLLRLGSIPFKEACMCLIGFTGTEKMVRAARRESLSILRKHKAVYIGKAMGNIWKKNRFRAPYLRNALWDLGYAVDTLETAVTWDKVTSTIDDIENSIAESMASWNEKAHIFSHLSHVYPSGSSIYTTFIFRIADTPEETLARWQAAKHAASQTIIQNQGTISHQHGIGIDHKSYLAAEKGALGMSSLKELCRHFDPDQRMNPSKLVD